MLVREFKLEDIAAELGYENTPQFEEHRSYFKSEEIEARYGSRSSWDGWKNDSKMPLNDLDKAATDLSTVLGAKSVMFISKLFKSQLVLATTHSGCKLASLDLQRLCGMRYALLTQKAVIITYLNNIAG